MADPQIERVLNRLRNVDMPLDEALAALIDAAGVEPKQAVAEPAPAPEPEMTGPGPDAGEFTYEDD